MDLTSKKNFLSSLKLSEQVVSGILTFAFGLALYGMLFGFTYHRVTNATECFLDICLLNLGVACGWLLGIYISPDTQVEADRFTRLGTAVGSFITGYILSKSDNLLSWVFLPENWSYSVAFRFILWLSGLLIASLVSYTLREYILASPVAVIPKQFLIDLPAKTKKRIDLPSDLAPSSYLQFILLKGTGPVVVGRVTQDEETPLVSTLLNVNEVRLALKQYSELGTGPLLMAVNSGDDPLCLRVEIIEMVQQ